MIQPISAVTARVVTSSKLSRRVSPQVKIVDPKMMSKVNLPHQLINDDTFLTISKTAATAAAASLCPSSDLVSSAISSISGGPTSGPQTTSPPNATHSANGSASATPTQSTISSTGAAASILPGGFAAAALVAAIFAL